MKQTAFTEFLPLLLYFAYVAHVWPVVIVSFPLDDYLVLH